MHSVPSVSLPQYNGKHIWVGVEDATGVDVLVGIIVGEGVTVLVGVFEGVTDGTGDGVVSVPPGVGVGGDESRTFPDTFAFGTFTVPPKVL